MLHFLIDLITPFIVAVSTNYKTLRHVIFDTSVPFYKTIHFSHVRNHDSHFYWHYLKCEFHAILHTSQTIKDNFSHLKTDTISDVSSEQKHDHELILSFGMIGRIELFCIYHWGYGRVACI
jgi:hypothetical protein